MFSVNVPPRGDRPRALGVTLVGRSINICTRTVCMLPLQMCSGRLDPRLVDALQVSHNGSGILGVIFL